MSDVMREAMGFDVVVVGGGPAGLASAIRLKQLAQQSGQELSVCLIDKGSEIGAHILSGAVMDPKALNELIPDWKERGAPLNTPVTQDQFRFMGQSKSWLLPSWMLPNCFENHGNTIISLSDFCRWLGTQAEELGVEIYAGFAGVEVLFDESGAVRGVATGDMGRSKNGEPGPNFQPGIELVAKYTLFAEGCRGQLGKQLEAHFHLRDDSQPQTYALGVKELWEVKPEQHQAGLVTHTAGWPLQPDTYGGGFIYHLDKNRVAIGFVTGLGYQNPYLSPFEEMQRFKTHPQIRTLLEGGKRLSYGARALVAGGLQALPKTIFPGGALVGDDAGFLNAPRIKGSHAALKTGMLAAEACYQALRAGRSRDELTAYPEAFKNSWLYEELYRARNFKPWLAKGLYWGSLMFGIDQLLFRGKAPWTLSHQSADHEKTLPAAQCQPIEYPKPDGVLTFDKTSSVYLSNTNHDEDEPCHLQLKDPEVAIRINYQQYASPEQRYCPAGVYEIVTENNQAALRINAQNCVHCKTCDIKDMTQNITWVAPMGGEGPLYQGM